MNALFLSFTSLVCAMEPTNEHQSNSQFHVVAYHAQQARTEWFDNVYAYAKKGIIQKNPDWVIELMGALHAMTTAERAQIANLCHENKKFSERAQYELLLRFKERNEKIPETLFKHFDKDLIAKKEITREQLKALLFMEKAFPALMEAEQPNDLKKEQIKEDIVPYQDQNKILDLIRKDNSFSAVEKEFRRMILDADRETLSALSATAYKPLKYLVNNLFDEEKGLTEEEWTEVSPDIREMLESLRKTLNKEETPAQRKKNKHKTEEDKFSNAKNKIFEAKPFKASHGFASLPEDYEKSEGLIALKEKNITWENLQKEIKNLGGEPYKEGYHYKITFYLGGDKEKPEIVTKQEYQEINGKDSFKHQLTRTTHLPHGHKGGLDPQFQEDVMEMIRRLFGDLV